MIIIISIIRREGRRRIPRGATEGSPTPPPRWSDGARNYYVYMCTYIYIYIYFIYLNMYIYIYIHVCVYTLYIYIYIHVYIWPLSRVLITNSPTTRSDKPSTFKTTHWASPLWQCIVWTVTGCSETMVGEIAFKSPYLKHPDHRRALNTYYLLKVRLICCALSLANASSVYRIIDYICQMFVKCVNICQTFEIYA